MYHVSGGKKAELDDNDDFFPRGGLSPATPRGDGGISSNGKPQFG
jgi:hypothetical protein